MAGSRKPGPIGLSGEVEDLNDGTMIRALSPRPGPIGMSPPSAAAFEPASNSADTSSVDRLLQRLRTVSSGEELQRIAVALLGPQCFSAGVAAGIGVDVFSSAKELIHLVGTFVLADLHDLRTGKISSWRYANPLTAPRLLSANLAALFFQEELHEAAAERDAIIKELSDVLQNPKASFEGLADGVAEGYKRDWQEFNTRMNAGTLEGKFRAGMIFGQLLVDILGVLTGVVGLAKAGAKVATKLPRLVKYARSPKLKPGMRRTLHRSGGGKSGAAEAPPKPVPERAAPQPIPSRQVSRPAEPSPPKSAKIPSKRTPNLRPDLHERWFKANGELDWPPDRGFSGEPKPTTLPVGKKIDRYGPSGGSCLSPEGTPYAERALPYDQSKMKYHVYEVVKPLDVKSGSIAPHFDQPGNGIQYETSRSVQQLIDEGYLKEVSQ